MRRIALAVLFLLAGSAFFLAFQTETCSFGGEDHELRTLTGLDIVSGTTTSSAAGQVVCAQAAGSGEGTFDVTALFSGNNARNLSIVALASAVLGIGLAFLRGRLALLATLSGLVGAVAMILLMLELRDPFPASGPGYELTASTGIGLWLAIGLSALAGVGAGIAAFGRRAPTLPMPPEGTTTA